MKKDNEEGINDILKGMINELDLKQKLSETKIKSLWGEMMGPTINRYTKSIRLRKQKLFIEIVSGPLKQELTYGREKIRKNINKELGEDYIKDVVIR